VLVEPTAAHKPSEPARAASVLASLGARVVDDPASVGQVERLVLEARQLADVSAIERLGEQITGAFMALAPNARVVITGLDACENSEQAAAQRALDGLARSLARELGRRGSTVQLLRASANAQAELAGPLGFFLAPESAYVTGQTIRCRPSFARAPEDPALPLADRIFLVTGAGNGIGRAVVERLDEAGARVLAVDLPEHVPATPARWLGVDLAAFDAAECVTEFAAANGGCDGVVHCAGILRDRSFARMSDSEWRSVIEVNLAVPVRVTRALLDAGLMRDGGSIVALSSISAIAGNYGQTNYAASKAGLIGWAEALATELAPRGITVNAVAPGFIETRLTRAMPWMVRTFAQRFNALGQAGLPIDVAAAVAFLLGPGGAGVNGQILRVCGGSPLGA